MKTLLPIALAAALSSCRQEEVTRVQVPKSAAVTVPPAAAPAHRLRWTAPAGWKESAGTGMRLATIVPPGAGKAEATVVALPGESGGELANVNRWRGQIGLSPIDESGLASARSTVRTKVGPASLYSFAGHGEPKMAMLAAVVVYEGTSWFLKLSGDEDAVKRARTGFVSLVASLSP
jgi:hypothetical protein